MKEFVAVYHAEDRERRRRESDRFKCFSYSELMKREKANLDIFWLKDDSLTDIDNLAKPEALASAILRDLEDAMKAFGEVEKELKR